MGQKKRHITYQKHDTSHSGGKRYALPTTLNYSSLHLGIMEIPEELG